MPVNRKGWLDLLKYSPGVDVFCPGAVLLQENFPWGRAFDHLKKIPPGGGGGGGVLALGIDWCITYWFDQVLLLMDQTHYIILLNGGSSVFLPFQLKHKATCWLI